MPFSDLRFLRCWDGLAASVISEGNGRGDGSTSRGVRGEIRYLFRSKRDCGAVNPEDSCFCCGADSDEDVSPRGRAGIGGEGFFCIVLWAVRG